MHADIPLETRIVLITGTQSAEKAKLARELTTRVDSDFADFDSETIAADGIPIDRLLSAVSTAPFGDGKRVVLVTHAEQLDDATQKKLASGIDKIPSSSLMILLTGEPVIEDGKAKKGTTVITELSTAVKKHGKLADFGVPQKDDLRAYVERLAKARGKQLRPDAIALFMDLPADDMRRLETELGKLFDYMGDEVVIHASDVTEVLTRGPDEVIFKLCDALGARRGGEALRLLDSTFQMGTKPDGTALRVLTMLARQIRLVHQARILLEYRMIGRGAVPLSAEVAAMLPADGIKATLANPRMAWMGDKLATQAKQWTFDGLEAALVALEHADGALKGIVPGGDNPREIIEECIIRMCA